jgi:TRAP-type C4-dicarboxylate transport system substrate-binding protein
MKICRHLAVLAACCVIVPVTAAKAAPRSIRIATVAPKSSSWGKVYAAWQKALEKKTEGKLELEIYFNGVQGNEDAMVSKIRTGQLDGAAITAIGLGMIYKSVLVLQLPGVLTKWEDLDRVRKQLEPEMVPHFKSAGFDVAGWGDVGLIRQFSKGFEIHHPADVKDKRPAVWRNEPTGPALYATIGNIVPVPVDAMEMLPALRSGGVNLIAAPALAAEQLQWTPYLDHVNDEVITCALGALIFKAGVIESLPADVKATWDDVQKRVNDSQQGRIRKLDEEAYGRITQKMAVSHFSQAEHDEWEKLLRKVVKGLAHGTYEKSLVNKVLTMRGLEPVE